MPRRQPSGVLIAAAPPQIKGFAITLAIGVVASLVSSIVITHNLLAIVLRSRWARSAAALGVAERAREDRLTPAAGGSRAGARRRQS